MESWAWPWVRGGKRLSRGQDAGMHAGCYEQAGRQAQVQKCLFFGVLGVW